MATSQITWEQFSTLNQTAKGVKLKFEDLCRQLFINEFLSENKNCRYVHSNPNNPGLESEPIYDEHNQRNIGYQVKFFDSNPDYNQILHSAKKTVEYYAGKVDVVYLFCNKPLNTDAKGYIDTVNILQSAGICMEPITDDTVLDLVRKYPCLGLYYFGYQLIEHDWFVKHTNYMFSNLGDRFNKRFNVDTKSSLYLSLFIHDKDAVDYLNGKKKKLINELDNLGYGFEKYNLFIRTLREAVLSLPDVCEDDILDVLKWNEKIQNSIILEKSKLESEKNDLEREYDRYTDIAFKTDKMQNDDDNGLSLGIINEKHKALKNCNTINDQLYKLDNLLHLLEQIAINDIEKKMLTSKFLTIKGNAGIGKSQLLAHEAGAMIEEQRDVLLLLGGTYLSNAPIQEQIMGNLSLDYSFKELIDIMEAIGQRNNQIVPILIDALNETWNNKLWKTSLSEIVDIINEKRYVRLVITYRSEYEKNLLNDTMIDGIMSNAILCIEHYGFAENTIEAVQEFMNYYNIPFTPLDYFGYEMSNPLFLTLYCKTYQGDEVDLPTLYDRILEYANNNIHESMAEALKVKGYDKTEDLLTPLIDELSEFLFKKGRRFVTKKELINFDYWANYDIVASSFISRLIKEHILCDSVADGEEVIYFSYDQMNDYYIARTIVSKFNSQEDIREYLAYKVLAINDGRIENYGNLELFVNACALYAEKYSEECIDIIDIVTDEHDRNDIFEKYIESFQWRRRDNISSDIMGKMLEKYPIRKEIVWKVFIGNSIKAAHPLNADYLHMILMRYELNRRDYEWTTYINKLSLNEDDRIIQLIQMYNEGRYLETSGNEQTELLLTLFGWLLTSSDRWLRDITSKAMIEILKRNFNLCEVILQKFKMVNDPYVIQRLYGVVFGACCKRISSDYEVYLSLAEYVYNAIFDQEKVYPDILLRDYARLIIERYLWEYPEYKGIIDIEKIVPPYDSEPIPDVEEHDYSGKDHGYGTTSIIHSMCFEGMGLYGDFGRYVFQSALHDFEVDDKKIHDYALSFIFEELGYKDDYFEDSERSSNRFNYNRHDTIKVERIGKKYQWIAMYNILARVTDHYVMRERFGDKEELRYEGAWEPYVRDFDPTLNNCFMTCPDAPFFDTIDQHKNDIKTKRDHINIASKENAEEWLNKESTFLKYVKEDLVLTDEKGDEWITLIRYADTDHDAMKEDNLLTWSWVYGYFVSEKQATELKALSEKKVDFRGNDYWGINEMYSIYSREYPWAPSCRSFKEYAWRDLEIPTGEKELIKEKHQVPDFESYDKLLEQLGYIGNGAEGIVDEDFEIKYHEITYEKEVEKVIGKVLLSASYLLWEEGYDASKQEAISRSVPCAEMIEDMKLREPEYDGFYYDPEGKLAAFDTELNGQKAGCVVRKDILDSFLKGRNMRMVWLIDASKEIHGSDLMITKSSEWSAALLYDGKQAQGDIYRIERWQ